MMSYDRQELSGSQKSTPFVSQYQQSDVSHHHGNKDHKSTAACRLPALLNSSPC
jgi:hypothetical protein